MTHLIALYPPQHVVKVITWPYVFIPPLILSQSVVVQGKKGDIKPLVIIIVIIVTARVMPPFIFFADFFKLMWIH